MSKTLRIILPLALLSLAAINPGPAQQKAEKPVYVVTYVDVFPPFAADTAKNLEQLAADSKKDPGFVRFEALRDVARTNHFTILEVWQTRQAYEAHLMQEPTKRFREKLQPGLGSPFDDRMYNLLP
jgi:quinol monooxygenase YgiN